MHERRRGKRKNDCSVSSAFRGGSDVFPISSENRTTGHSGYAPAYANEWQRGIREKPSASDHDEPSRCSTSRVLRRRLRSPCVSWNCSNNRVHRRQLMDQWIERPTAFSSLPRDAIGMIGGGRRKPKGEVDVEVIQSLIPQRRGQ
jgi:hypothetical protein